MAGVQSNITIAFNSDDLRRALARLEGSNLKPFWQDVGEAMLNSIEERFRTETAPDGEKWMPLSAKYAKRKKNKLILTETTDLRRIHYEANATGVLIGTSAKYGAAHQFGLNETQTYVTQREKGVGRQWTRKMKLPARPFLGVSDDDVATVLEIFETHFAATWKGES